MEGKQVGIELSGSAASFPVEGIPAIIALAEAIRANADAVKIVAQRFEGTPAIQGASISNCSITMGPQPKKVRKRKVR